ncbi:MAG: YidC/Oxa1 family membrane protein insertase [Patescibacteria group bacterium]|nr:YidC/Oxa1 family membrane protein insertase [Patescibacteria group bacterium]
MSFIFNEILVRPIINILLAIYQVLFAVHVPYALGFSIIILTIIIRFILYPLTASQLKASKKMQQIAPHLSHLKQKHKGDAKRIQQETMRLYKEHGVNPAAGCLPIVIQLPIIWALYSVLQKVVRISPSTLVSEVNKLAYPLDFLKLSHPWDQYFFGIPLGQTPSTLIKVMPLIMLVPALTALFQFVQSKMMFSKPKEEVLKEQGVKTKKEPKKEEDFAAAFQKQSLYIFPVMIGFFSYSFPIGLSLYWNTFTLFGILQQYKIQGLGGLEEWTKKKKK